MNWFFIEWRSIIVTNRYCRHSLLIIIGSFFLCLLYVYLQNCYYKFYPFPNLGNYCWMLIFTFLHTHERWKAISKWRSKDVSVFNCFEILQMSSCIHYVLPNTGSAHLNLCLSFNFQLWVWNFEYTVSSNVSASKLHNIFSLSLRFL